MPPLWKLRRELFRIPRVIKRLLPYIFDYYFLTAYYDRFLLPCRTIYQGQKPLSGKVAIFVIYPIHGLKPSHLAALRYLTTSGYSPFLVSNFPLQTNDRNLVLANCWKLIERPNCGYDFGAYRDAILYIHTHQINLDRVALFNDSCWFPIPATSSWLYTAEANELDLVSSASNSFLKPPTTLELCTVNWAYDDSVPTFHLSSFSLLISGRLISNPDFITFWRRLRLSNQKKYTVTRCEMGLTKWVKASRYTFGTTLDISNLDIELAGLDMRSLKQVLQSMIVIEATLASEKAILVSEYRDSDCWKLSSISFILRVVYFQSIFESLPDYLIRYHEFGFLKKAPARYNVESARTMLSIANEVADNCDFDLPREVREVGSLD